MKTDSAVNTLSLLVKYGNFDVVYESWSLVFHLSVTRNFYDSVLPLAISCGNFDLASAIMTYLGKNDEIDAHLINGLLLSKKEKLMVFISLSFVKRTLIEFVKKKSSPKQSEFVLKAVDYEHIQLAKILLMNGLGLYSLHYAVNGKNEKAVKALACLVLESRGTINILDHNFDTPVALAIKDKWFEGVLILIEDGKATINVKDDDFNYMIRNLDLNKAFILIKHLFQFANHRIEIDWEKFNDIYQTFNPRQKNELQLVAPIEESFQMRLIGNVWGLRGEIKTKQLKTSLAGSFQPQYLAEQILQEFKIFLNIDSQNTIFQQKIKNKLLENLEFFIKPVMGKPMDAIDIVKTGRSACVCIFANDHVFYLVLHGDWLYLCNRGRQSKKEKRNGVLRFHIKDSPSVLSTFLSSIGRAMYTELVFDICDNFIDRDLKRNSLDSFSIIQSAQKNQNCPSSSFKSAILAWLIQTSGDVVQAKEVYKKYTTYLRESMLNKLLAIPREYIRVPLDQIRSKIENPHNRRWNLEQKKNLLSKIDRVLQKP